MTFHIREDPLQVALGVDDVRLSIGKRAKSWNGESRSVPLGHSATFIGQHEKVQPFGSAELSILFDSINADTNNLSIQLTERINISLKPTSLQGATRCESACGKITKKEPLKNMP
jgi:hypothetical protein